MIDSVLVVWCHSCFRWHRTRSVENKAPWWVRRRRLVAAPARKLLATAHAVIGRCDRLLDDFCFEGDSPPPFDPPPGFVERGTDWAEYPKGTRLP